MWTGLLLLLLWAHQCGLALATLRTIGGLHRATGGLAEVAGGPGAMELLLRRSKRGWAWNQFYLMEEYMGDNMQYVGKLHSDQDPGDGTVRYVLTGEGAGDVFTIDPRSGDIHAIKRLDREERATYTLRARAVSNKTSRSLEDWTNFTIKIHDINDNAPTFTKSLYMASVPEMSDVGTSVITVTATDADDISYGNSARVVYSILQGQPYFSVEPNTGLIRTALQDMNRENREHYQVVIQGKDMAGQMGGLSGTTTVSITLSDVNNNPPRFPQGVYQFTIPESAQPGSVVGELHAKDNDEGRNAEMEYKIVSEEGRDIFKITTDKDNQKGILTLNRPVDYENKRMYSLRVQVENRYLDPRFRMLGPFHDTAVVKVAVEDENEPPVFQRSPYLMEALESAPVGTIVGSVSAMDPDNNRSPVRYSIDRHTDMDRVFNVYPGNGSVYLQKPLDREELPWHNISIRAEEFNNLNQISRVPVSIKVLDVNDNPPTFATFYETFVCENAKAGQRIQMISAADPDEPIRGQRFSFRLAPEASVKANFTVRDNNDNTAMILTLRSGYSRLQRSRYLVPVVISDGGSPMLSSTNTLTVRVCSCDRDGNMKLCNAEALVLTAGLSTGALVAILLCVCILLMLVVLFAALRRQRKKEPLIISKEDVRDNVVSYNDEGGGEEDTQAFDIGTLRNPEALEDSKLRRDIIPDALFPPLPRRPPPSSVAAAGGGGGGVAGALRDNTDVRNFISQRLADNDSDPTAPPYDSLATYAYEGSGSVAQSLSSLESAASEGDHDYNYLSDWGPRFKKLADMYGAEESDKDS
ncbi:cadherin-10-like isoform X2 [Clupea harengus]|uniref:Cadherin-10-like isoform X2 n=1 Tax=Clupea harengus TaxID=7950 RepID=A0A6P8GLH1_CLUHA|nr:cadherin-10-like isoform X2 [Clupea harengus]